MPEAWFIRTAFGRATETGGAVPAANGESEAESPEVPIGHIQKRAGRQRIVI